MEISILAFSLKNHNKGVRQAAAALTLTEMHFKPLPIRIVEYIYIISLFLRGKSYLSVTAGISQISLRHISKRTGINGLGLLKVAVDARSCLDECCYVIGRSDNTSVSKLATTYNGKSTPYYRRLLDNNYERVGSIFEKLNR